MSRVIEIIATLCLIAVLLSGCASFEPQPISLADTITLSESLGLTVIAEGVEIESQRDFLARHGCHAYQGYLFSRPLPIDGFEEFAQRV